MAISPWRMLWATAGSFSTEKSATFSTCDLARVAVHNKIHGLEGKQLLRSVAAKHLPDEIVHRRKKPFGAPVVEWVDHLIRMYLHDSKLVSDGLIKSEYLSALLDKDRLLHGVHTRIWALIVLELWYRAYIRRDQGMTEHLEEQRPVQIASV